MAVEKVLFAALRALIATSVMIPIGIGVLGSVPWRWSGFPLFLAMVVLGCAARRGARTRPRHARKAEPDQHRLRARLHAAALHRLQPVPWPSLSRLRWFQIVTACNPMTYVSEGLRAALNPSVPHIRPWICLAALAVSISVLLAIGVRGFYRRAID